VSVVAARPAAESGLAGTVMRGLAWRSGSQIFAQLVTWGATFLVLRLLGPADYGLFAMTQSVLALLGMLAGASFASALVRQETLDPAQVRQVFGLLILLNAGLAAIQFALAPLVAAYFRQPLVADLLRVQVLLYVANPFLALGGALLARKMDFRAQAIANFCAAFAGAGTALGGALSGFGVWTLVAAPIAMFWVRAIGLTIVARLAIRPSFDVRGAGATIGFGLAMIVSQLFWFVQTQADVFIGGRAFGAHDLGLYTTALFLAQILTAKFVPPMNEVAFAAYARLQHNRAGLAAAFARSTGLIMLVALPFYAGMAITARPLVLTMLGDHWAGAVPMVRWLACAMPFVTLQILFAPATNAIGRPRFAVYGAIAGAIIMPAAFLIAVGGGPEAMALAWIAAFPLVATVTAAISLRALALRWRMLFAALRPPLLASGLMVALLLPLNLILPPLAPPLQLAMLVAAGGICYLLGVHLFARAALRDLLALVRNRAAG